MSNLSGVTLNSFSSCLLFIFRTRIKRQAFIDELVNFHDERVEREWRHFHLAQTNIRMIRDIRYSGHECTRKLRDNPFLLYQNKRRWPSGIIAALIGTLPNDYALLLSVKPNTNRTRFCLTMDKNAVAANKRTISLFRERVSAKTRIVAL